MKHRLIWALLAAAMGPLRLPAADPAPPREDASAAVAAATNQAGLELFHQLAAGGSGGNLIISPYSISSALALVYAGAEGKTRTEIGAAFHYPADETVLRQGFAGLRSGLQPNAGQWEWHAANRLFGQTGYTFRPAFLSLMADGYDAPFEALDFRQNSERARGKINAWVKDQTGGKIPQLVPAGGIDSKTRLVLVNALDLKARWEHPFDAARTRPAPFHLTSGGAPQVPMMNGEVSLGYAPENGMTVVALPYAGGRLQCLILLPDPGRSLKSAGAALTSDDFVRWRALGQTAPPIRIRLALPKFRTAGATLPLGPALRGLGIKSAFNEPLGSANFDPIAPPNTSGRRLYLSDVFHQTFVAIDEAGTEAAAATAATMGLAAVMQRPAPLVVRIDRPFLFALQDRVTGLCLFLGRISDPR